MAPHVLLPTSRSVSASPAFGTTSEKTFLKRITTTAVAAGVAVVAAKHMKVETAGEGSAGRKKGTPSATTVAAAAAAATTQLPAARKAEAGAARLCAMAPRQAQHTAVMVATPQVQEKSGVVSKQQNRLSALESRTKSESSTKLTAEEAAAAAAESRTAAAEHSDTSMPRSTRNSTPRVIAAADLSMNGSAAAAAENRSRAASRSPISSDAIAVSAVLRCADPATSDKGRLADVECAAASFASASCELHRFVSAAYHGDVTGVTPGLTNAALAEAKAAAGKEEAVAGELKAAAREGEAAAEESKTTRGEGISAGKERELASRHRVPLESSVSDSYKLSDDVAGEDDLVFLMDARVPWNDKFYVVSSSVDASQTQFPSADTRGRKSSENSSAESSCTNGLEEQAGGGGIAPRRTATSLECKFGSVQMCSTRIEENKGTATAVVGPAASSTIDLSSTPREGERHACVGPGAISVIAPTAKEEQAGLTGRSVSLDKNAWPSLEVSGILRNQRKPEQQLFDFTEKELSKKINVKGGRKDRVSIEVRKDSEPASVCPTVIDCSKATGSTRIFGSRSWSAATARVGAGRRGGQKLQEQQRQQEGGDNAGGNSSDCAGGHYTERGHAALDGQYASTATRARTAIAKRSGGAFQVGNDERIAGHRCGARQQQQVTRPLNWRQQQRQRQQQQQSHQQQRQKEQEWGRQNCRSAVAVAATPEKTAARQERKATGAAAARTVGPTAGEPGWVPVRAARDACVQTAPSSFRPSAAVCVAAGGAHSSTETSAAGDGRVTALTSATRHEVRTLSPAAPWSCVLPSAVFPPSPPPAAAAPSIAERARNRGETERDGFLEGDSSTAEPAAAADAGAAAALGIPAAAAAEDTAATARRENVTVAASAAAEDARVAGVVHRAPPGLAGPDLHTALLRAAFLGRTDIIAACLQRGADVSFCDRIGRSALHYAAATGAESGLKLLLAAGAYKDVNKRDHKYWTPLLIAVTKTHLACTRLLLQHGAKVNMVLCHRCAPCRSTTSNTFMHRRYSQTVSADSRDHALVAKREAEGTAVPAAATVNNSAAEPFIAAVVPSPDRKDIGGGRGCRSHSIVVGEPAPEEPASSCCSSKTASPRKEAKRQQQEGKCQQQEHENGGASDECENGRTRGATPLLEKGTGGGDSNASEEPGAEVLHLSEAPSAQTWSSAIHFAAIKGSVEISRLLVSYGATVNDLDSDNRPPLHYAACRDNTLYVKWLLDQGACVDLLDINKRSALHAAALKGQLQNAETLLGATTDNATAFFLLKKKDIWDISATQLAQLHGHKGLQQLLESYTKEMEERIGAKEAARLMQQQQLPGTSSLEPTQLNATIVEVLATGLREEKRGKLERAVGRLGTMICLKAYHKTMLIQENGVGIAPAWSQKHRTLLRRRRVDILRPVAFKEAMRLLLLLVEEDGEVRRAQRRRTQQQQQQRRGDGGDSVVVTAGGCGGPAHTATQPKKQQHYERQLLQALPFAGFPPVASAFPSPHATASANAVCTAQISACAAAAVPRAPAAVSDTNSSTNRRESCPWKPQQKQQRQLSLRRQATSGLRYATPATGQRGHGDGRGRRGPGGQEVLQRNSVILRKRVHTDENRPAVRVAVEQKRSTTPCGESGEAAVPADAGPAPSCTQCQAFPPNVADLAAAATAAGAASAAAAAAMYPFQMYPLMPFWPLGLPYSIPCAAGAATNPAAAPHSAAATRAQYLPLSFAALPTLHSNNSRTPTTAGWFSTADGAGVPMPSTGSCLAGAALRLEAGHATTFPSVVDPALPLALASAANPSIQQLLLQQQLFQAAAVWRTGRTAPEAFSDGSTNCRTLLSEDCTHAEQPDNPFGNALDLSTLLEKRPYKQQKPRSKPRQQKRWLADSAVGATKGARSTRVAATQEKKTARGLSSCRNGGDLNQSTCKYTGRTGGYEATAATRGGQTGDGEVGTCAGNIGGKNSR